jgi:prophage DNA circulation protein
VSEIWDEIMSDARLGDVTFPLRRRGLSFGRDGGRIAPPHQPGQRIADTGRTPIVFTLDVPLYSGVEGRDDLYPTVYEELLDVVADEETKGEVEYIDPILGAFDVKVVKVDDDHDAERRDGCTLTITLEEITTDPFGLVVPPRAPGREVIEAAADLDEELDELGVNDTTIAAAFAESGYPKSGEETSWPAGRTFESLASDFGEALQLGTLYADRVAAQVDTVRARVRATIELPALRSTRGWLAYASALRLIEALAQQADRAIARAVPVVSHEVRGVASVYDIATQLYGDPRRADEILQRNRIPRPYAIPAGTVLRVAER